MKLKSFLLSLLLTSCATSTTGLTKDQIAARESARNARISFYAQVASGLAVGLANTYGLKK